MANTTRINAKTVTKFYDTAKSNGWDLNFEYESENGLKPKEIKVTGLKGTGSIYYQKSEANSSITFGGAASTDTEVITFINAEFIAITDSFTQTPG